MRTTELLKAHTIIVKVNIGNYFLSAKFTFIFSNPCGSIKVACNYQLLVILTCFGRFVDIGIKFLLLLVCAVTVGRRIYVDNTQVETVDLEVNTHHSRIIVVWIFDLNILSERVRMPTPAYVFVYNRSSEIQTFHHCQVHLFVTSSSPTYFL